MGLLAPGSRYLPMPSMAHEVLVDLFKNLRSPCQATIASD
jgi:hypothetical protein